MNVLLVMPKTSGLWDEWATPPIGITYVSSYLKENGVQVYTLNLNLEEEDIETVLRNYIQKYHSIRYMVCISCFMRNFRKLPFMQEKSNLI